MVKRVVRDDGENGLWISHPAQSANMHHLSREEFRSIWELKSSGIDQEASKSVFDKGNPYKDLELGGFSFDEQKSGPPEKNEVKIDVNQDEIVPTVIKGAL